MTQAELDRQVAAKTGETVAEIQRRGFSFVDVGDLESGHEPVEIGQHVDWDEQEAERYALLPC